MNIWLVPLVWLTFATTHAWCQISFFPFQDDFDGPNAASDDDDPVTWEPGLMITGTANVMDGNYVMSGGNFSTMVSKGGNVVVAKDTLAQARLTLDGDDPFGFATIFSRGLETGESYFGGIQAVQGTIFVGELFANGQAEFIQMPTTLSPSTRDVIIQLVTFGDRITLSAWDAEGDKPTSPPTLTITDDTLTEGGFGLALGGNALSGVSFRSFKIGPVPACDFNGDGMCDTTDINQLMNEVASESNGATFDLTIDGVVDDADRDEWLTQASTENGYAERLLVGDSNLDGTVDASDLNALALNWRQEVDDWTAGNFSRADVNAVDLNALALNWRQSTPLASATAPVPEPSTGLLTIVGLIAVWRRPKRHL